MVEMWINSFAAPRGIEKVAHDRAKWLGWTICRKLSKFVRRSLCGPCYGREGHRAYRTCARSYRFRDTARCRDRVFYCKRRPHLQRWAILGIGRGDSALAHLGYAPARLDNLRSISDTLSPICAAMSFHLVRSIFHPKLRHLSRYIGTQELTKGKPNNLAIGRTQSASRGSGQWTTGH